MGRRRYGVVFVGLRKGCNFDPHRPYQIHCCFPSHARWERYRLPMQEKKCPHTLPHAWALLFSTSIWIRPMLSHLFFVHDNIMHFVTLRIRTAKCNRPRLSLA